MELDREGVGAIGQRHTVSAGQWIAEERAVGGAGRYPGGRTAASRGGVCDNTGDGWKCSRGENKILVVVFGAVTTTSAAVFVV